MKERKKMKTKFQHGAAKSPSSTALIIAID